MPTKPSGETKISGENGGREMFIFPVQLTMSRIGSLTRLIHTLAICVTIQRHTDASTVYVNIMSESVLTFKHGVACRR